MATFVTVLIAVWHLSVKQDGDMFQRVTPITLAAILLLIIAIIAYAVDIQQIGNVANTFAAMLLVIEAIRQSNRPKP